VKKKKLKSGFQMKRKNHEKYFNILNSFFV